MAEGSSPLSILTQLIEFVRGKGLRGSLGNEAFLTGEGRLWTGKNRTRFQETLRKLDET